MCGRDQDIPSAEQAFVLQPAPWDGKEVVVGWRIAPGSDLYRDKLVVEAVAPPGTALETRPCPRMRRTTTSISATW